MFFQAFRALPGTLFIWSNAMKLTVNGEQHDHQSDASVDSLLEELGANKSHTALMINGNVIPSDDWKTHQLKESDEVEMLVFVGGG